MPEQTKEMVELVDLRAGYGALPVLHGFSIAVAPGEVAVLLGLNGAGKSTAVKVLCGAVAATGGSVRYRGEEITGCSTAGCVQKGIVMVPEGRRVFGGLSVERNLQVGSWTQRGNRGWVEAQRAHVYEVLPRLAERRDQLAGTLSGGEQQMLAIGRGLMANPSVLVIDEASLGLAPVIVREILKIARNLAEEGTTVILVEQNVGALEVADVGFFVDQGVVTATLRGKELADGELIRSLYLG
ncbi:MAG: ABC transporter ATP-binding protein [Acidimicrobiales bacterium]|nr:ABC transporter ATP-binding protein [Acidimicrobiales bacterium]